jgi:Zinc carboxypeptidase
MPASPSGLLPAEHITSTRAVDLIEIKSTTSPSTQVTKSTPHDVVNKQSDIADDEQAVARLLQLADQWRDSSHRVPSNGIGNGPWVEPNTFVYQSHEQLTSLLHSYATNYSHITRLYSVGKSVNNQDLWVMEISDNPGTHEPGKL